jgi:hypothetical protein
MTSADGTAAMFVNVGNPGLAIINGIDPITVIHEDRVRAEGQKFKDCI